jgi:SAM-dependent methyltransferase
MTSSTTTGTATVQGDLWSARADDWAEVQEGVMRTAFEAGLDALGVGPGTRLLDVGCGAGLVLRLAADRGADVSGLDASPAMVAHAQARVPGAPIVQGEIEELPFADGAFDAVTGFNSFQYAARPVHALEEAVRVLAPGGRVLMLTWGLPEQCEAAAYLAALRPFLPPPPPGAPGPFALSSVDALTAVLEDARLDVLALEDVQTVWEYPDEDTALRGLLASGPVVAAMRHGGEEGVTQAVRDFLASFVLPGGGYRITNVFRYVVGKPRA